MLACAINACAQIDIGSRRELFVDRFLIAEMEHVSLRLGCLQPAPPSPAPALSGHYATVMKDGDLFRQYCRHDEKGEEGYEPVRRYLLEKTLYAESADGVRWSAPKVVLSDAPPASHNFSPFIDTNPNCPPSQRYKAFGGHCRLDGKYLRKKFGDELADLNQQLPGDLAAFVSKDGVQWRVLKQDAVTLPKKWHHGFDSQNVAFWSSAEGQYVCYFRFSKDRRFRAAARTTSKDFIHWSEPVEMRGRWKEEHWYTTGTHPYFRAPHIYLAPATIFLDNEKSNTRVILMSSRAGANGFDRTFGQQSFLNQSASGNRANFLAWSNGAQTGDRELSFYNLGQRHTLRLDGFGSVSAGTKDGTLITKPLRFAGKVLELNFVTRPNGQLRVEILNEDDRPIDGYRLDECAVLKGDQIEQIVRWNSGDDVSPLAGKNVRLKFVLNNTDLFALRFPQ